MNIFDKLREMVMGIPETIPVGAVIIDVRSSTEYEGGHLEGAVSLPLGDIGQITQIVSDKAKPLVVYCASGMRSAAARASLLKMGYAQVINAGGMDGAAQRLNKRVV